MTPTLIVISGPTASGKTKAAIDIAKHFDAEIISADSRQFYHEIPIGTAAPTKEELNEVKHHFVGNLSIFDTYNIADYERDVISFLKYYFKFKKYAVLVGGSGLYVDAVCDGVDVMPDIDPEIRRRVEDIFKTEGLQKLQEEVQRHDPEYFKIVDQHNPRRLQRALEVILQTGKPFSSFHTKTTAPRDFNIIRLAVDCPRDILLERISQRTKMMMDNDFLEEAKKVFPYRTLNTLNTVGYKELFAYLEGKISYNEAVERIIISTRQYAKRQMTWLRKNKDYHWFKPSDIQECIRFIEELESSR